MSKIALQLYTIRNLLTSEKEILRTLKEVSKIGYRYVELAGLNNIETRELKTILDDCNLKCISMHITISDINSNIANIFNRMNILDISTATISSIPAESRNKNGYARIIPLLSSFAQDFSKHGYTLEYHNHSFEFEKIEKSLIIDSIFSEAPELYSELDLFWVAAGGGDPAFWIKKLKNRINAVHLKDYAIRNGIAVDVEVGEGNLNWNAIMKACVETAVKWYIIEQDNCENNPLDCIELSLRNLANMGVE